MDAVMETIDGVDTGNTVAPNRPIVARQQGGGDKQAVAVEQRLRDLSRDMKKLDMDMSLPEGSIDPAEAADTIASLRAEVERLTREQDEKIARALAKADYEAERAGDIENENDDLRARLSAQEGQAVATGFIDQHRQKFASAEKHNAPTLLKSGWTPVYLHPTPVQPAGNVACEGAAAIADDLARDELFLDEAGRFGAELTAATIREEFNLPNDGSATKIPRSGKAVQLNAEERAAREAKGLHVEWAEGVGYHYFPSYDPKLAVAALLASRHLPVGEGWRPIETAPRDGTKIQVWADGYEWPETVYYERYDEEIAADVGEPGYWRYAEELLADVAEIDPETLSYWQPLPQPPLASNGEDGR